ncbi:MAG: hypothetical protein IBJ17_19845, partial [Reyranella sp.]|nr:hypothetical protein [Reyranella sp.]
LPPPLPQRGCAGGLIASMEDRPSVRFGTLRGARNGRGVVTFCGEVDGRNGAGRPTGFVPFIGVLPAPPAGTARRRDTVTEFVLVEIGGTARDRAVVEGLCRESGLS